MQTKHITILFSVIISIFIISIGGCKKDDKKEAKPDYSDKYPVVETMPIHDICGCEAQSGGVIASDGGDMITQRGVCWNTQKTPTIADPKSLNGKGAGLYESLIENLEYNTTYNVRAYATNKWGTGYGNTLSFTTKSNDSDKIPTVDTENCYELSFNSASCIGKNINNGGYPLIEFGICFGPNPNPTINDIKVIGENCKKGFFEAKTNQLSNFTKYYYRAYATNRYGTAYGEDKDFKTFPPDGTEIKDIDGNIYHTKAIGLSVFLIENLRTTHLNDGTAISKIEDATEWSTLSTPAYCSYNNNEELAQEYGYLYNSFIITANANIAPKYWHIAKRKDYIELSIFSDDLTKHMKEPGTEHWISNGADTDNSSGFTALPGGMREHTGEFNQIQHSSYFWTINKLGNYYFFQIKYNNNNLCDYPRKYKTRGMSIRLAMDQSVDVRRH